MGTSKKVLALCVSITLILGLAQHICCILKQHDMDGMNTKPCVRVALISWDMDVEAGPGAEKDFEAALGRVFPGVMLHAARVLAEEPEDQATALHRKWSASFELHDGGDFAPGPVAASLCGGHCDELLGRIAAQARGWVPRTLAARVELDVSAPDSQARSAQGQVVARGVLEGRGQGKPDGKAAVSAVWWALAQGGVRRAVYAAKPLPPVTKGGPWEMPFRIVEWSQQPDAVSALAEGFPAAWALWQSQSDDDWQWKVGELAAAEAELDTADLVLLQASTSNDWDKKFLPAP